MSDLLKKIHSRGYWHVIIRPATFEEKRIPNISHLYPIVERCAVQLRGWDYPHVDTRTQPVIEKDWAGEEFDWEQFLEIWRLYQSGQFIHVFGMVEDWLDQSTLPTSHHWEAAEALAFGNALLQFTEVFEFAARLAVTEAGDQTMHIEITVHGLRGRTLVNDFRSGFPFRAHRADLDTLPYSIDIPQADLIANPRELALEPASELFRRFGKDVSQETLRALQERRFFT